MIFGFGDKAKDFFYESDARINILHGSVRSGKTTVANYRFLEFVLSHDYDNFLISGKTRDTIERNLIISENGFLDLLNFLDLPFKYNKIGNFLDIGDNRIWLIGFNDEVATEKIRGMTIGGWYADEVTSAPKSTVDMAITRCSVDGAQMFWTMNPQSPYHYIYTDYIINRDLLSSGKVKVWHFTLDDNIHLSKEYIEDLKLINMNSKLNYKRNILGEWVMAEGAIYDMFDESLHTFSNLDEVLNRCDLINICCDYGVSTVTVIGVMGVELSSDGNHYYLLDEFYYDGSKNLMQSDTDRVNVVYRFQEKYNLGKRSYIVLPHDATSFKIQLIQDPRIHLKVKTYRPNTYKDITKIQDLFSNNKFSICRSCENSVKQAQTYSWDLKAQENGVDKPLKVNDHCPDMWRGGILGIRLKRRRIIA